jgi:bile acid-coenzyme A ligase
VPDDVVPDDIVTASGAAPSFPQLIAQLAADRPDAVVVRHVAPDGRESTATWAQLHRRSHQLAGALAGRGLAHGDRLAIVLPSSLQLMIGTLAAWKLGAVPVPLRWDLPDWERARLRAVVDAAVQLDETDVAWIDSTADHPVPQLPDAVSPAINGICTSGSTGTPKVIVFGRPAHYHDAYSTPMASMWQPVARPQTIAVLAPMYHTTGFSTLLTMLGGDDLIVLEKFDAGRVVDLVEHHRVTTFTATPTMLKRLADLPDIEARDLSSIEWILQGAAPMPPSLVDRWIGLLGAERVFMAYGMSEALGLTALRGDEWQAHRGSVGRPQRGTEVRILDAAGDVLPPGRIGDVHLRSAGYGGSTYLGAPALATTPDGFASVGDMGHLDIDGYLYLADRRVDVVITGGANVFPAEVEMALIDHPAVADVVVIGLPDPEWGRRVHAIVEPRAGAAPPTFDEIVAYAKGRLAAYKVPKSLEIVDAVPRTSATKVNRRALIAERGG